MGHVPTMKNSFDEVSATTASLSIAQLISITCVKTCTRNATDESKPAMRHNREQDSTSGIYQIKNPCRDKERKFD